MAVLGVSAGNRAVSLTPAASVLRGAGTRFPVFIDPSWSTTEASSGSQPSWATLEQVDGVPHTIQWEPQEADGGIESGVSTSNSTGTGPGTDVTIARSFLNFPVPSAMWGADYADAALSIFQSHSWGCSTADTSYVTMWDTDSGGSNTPVTQSTAWPGATGNWDVRTAKDYGYSKDCPGQELQLSAAPTAVAAARNHWPWLTLRLSATDDDEASQNVWSWKAFQAAGGDGMHLDFFWRNAPYPPTHLGTQHVFDPATGQTGTNCSTDQGKPDWTSDNPVKWQANVNDVDNSVESGSKVIGQFNWKDTVTKTTGTIPSAENGQDNTGGLDPTPYQDQGGATFDASRKGTVGDVYQWDATGQTPAQASDQLTGQPYPQLTGPDSAADCYFASDTNPPLAPPLPKSDVYTSGVSGGAVGKASQFTFTDPNNSDPADGTNDVVGYKYGFSSRPATYVPGKTATVTITPYSESPAELDLYVEAVDRAGNPSTVTGPFKIVTSAPQSGIATMTWWPLNGSGGDSAGTGIPLSVPADFACSSPAGGAGYQCTLPGLVSSAQRPVVSNGSSFSVAAWVYVAPGAPCAAAGSCSFPFVPVVTQAGVNTDGFSLGLDENCGCFAFMMPFSDSVSAPVDEVKSQPLSQIGGTGKWVQLTGVYDSSQAQTLTLYVNGVQAGPAATMKGVPAWASPAAGPMAVGGDPGAWPGYVSDVCAFYGALPVGDVQTLATAGSDGCQALYQKYH